MGKYKRTDISEDATYDGFSFVDDDGDEFAVDVSDTTDCTDSVTLEYNGSEQFRFYACDIQKFIKMLQEADKYCKGL